MSKTSNPINKPLFEETLDDILFCLSFNPEGPYYVKGFVDGRVVASSYDSKGEVKELWSTKRHKGSCRALTYDQTGEHIFSVGLDKVIKKANSKDGVVKVKNADTIKSDPACICVNDSFVAVGTDEGDLYVFDQKDLSLIKHCANVHDDNMTAVFPLPENNKYHFVTCGSSTVAHLDIRKEEPLSLSEDQEDEILCGCMASDKTPVFGMSTGVLTKWNLDMEDQQHRVRLSQDSVDTVLPGEVENVVYAGCGDGILYKVNSRSSVILKKYKHGDDGVSIVDMDYQYHPVTADLDSIKIWRTDEEEEKYIKELAKAKEEEKAELGKRKSIDTDESDDEDQQESNEKKKKRKRGKKSAKNKAYDVKPSITAFEGL